MPSTKPDDDHTEMDAILDRMLLETPACRSASSTAFSKAASAAAPATVRDIFGVD